MKIFQFSLILMSFLLFTASIEAQKKVNELATVSSVDLKQYSGKWFEIARYPNKFQKQCVGNTTATYTQKTNGKIEVVNECLKKDGTVDKAVGEAKVVKDSNNLASRLVSWLPSLKIKSNSTSLIKEKEAKETLNLFYFT